MPAAAGSPSGPTTDPTPRASSPTPDPRELARSSTPSLQDGPRLSLSPDSQGRRPAHSQRPARAQPHQPRSARGSPLTAPSGIALSDFASSAIAAAAAMVARAAQNANCRLGRARGWVGGAHETGRPTARWALPGWTGQAIGGRSHRTGKEAEDLGLGNQGFHTIMVCRNCGPRSLAPG